MMWFFVIVGIFLFVCLLPVIGDLLGFTLGQLARIAPPPRYWVPPFLGVGVLLLIVLLARYLR